MTPADLRGLARMLANALVEPCTVSIACAPNGVFNARLTRANGSALVSTRAASEHEASYALLHALCVEIARGRARKGCAT